MLISRLLTGAVGVAALLLSLQAWANPDRWKSEWPDTDFSKHSVAFKEIFSGGPPKDGIPSIDAPTFVALKDVGTSAIKDIGEKEPVIGLSINGEAKAYPLRILIWHEIANDTIGGVPVSVTYCPLCNAAIVFDRRVEGKVLDFGTTGKLRNSDLVMYDRQTESWWQQFMGEGIVGAMTGVRLKIIPARLESYAEFKARFPDGHILVPNNPGQRSYGYSPYAGYDSAHTPFMYPGPYPGNLRPLGRVVRIGDRAWALDLLQIKERIETDDGLVITWRSGQNSAMDAAEIKEGLDIGSVVVQKKTDSGLVDVAYGIDYAFAFHAFFPDSKIVVE